MGFEDSSPIELGWLQTFEFRNRNLTCLGTRTQAFYRTAGTSAARSNGISDLKNHDTVKTIIFLKINTLETMML